MVSWFLRMEHLLTRLAMVVAILMLVVSVSLGFYQVLTRFIFDAPSTWSEVLSRTTMIWCVFMGAAAAFRGGFMMSVEVIYRLVPKRVLPALELAVGACCVLVLGVLVHQGVQMTLRVSNQTLSALEVSMSWAYAAIPVGSGFAMLSVLARLLAQLTGREALGPEREEPAELDAERIAQAARAMQDHRPAPLDGPAGGARR